MLVDTHCHLTDSYTDGAAAVIARAVAAGVDTMICATANPADIDGALQLATEYDNVFCTIGIHPEYAPIDAKKYLGQDVLNNPRVVGVGEIGLDYHFGDDNRRAQIELFTRQIEIARAAELPVAIHCRDAEHDAIDILKNVCGVMHCFTGTWDFARTMLDRGFYFSASGIITFKNADAVRDVFARIPIDRIVIETDSPYCAPVPYRGRQCEPAMVVNTARVIADIKKLPYAEMIRQLAKNTAKLYPKLSCFGA